MLWSPARVPVYSRNWAILEVARLEVFKPLLPDGMDEEEGAPAHTETLMVKLSVCNPPDCRTSSVMTDEGCGLEGVCHHLPHDYEIKLVVTQLSKGGSRAPVMLYRKEAATL